MTKEEAIKRLEILYLCSAERAEKEAIGMAIAALREQDATDTNVGHKTNADHIRSMTD